MDIKRITPYPDHCSVTLDMPWDVAEALVSSGPALIKSLREVVKHHKQKVEQDEHLNSFRNKNASKPEFEWWPLAVKADKRIRSLTKNDGMKPSRALNAVAKEFHFPHASMQAIISVHRKMVKEETARTRTLEIIQLHFRGISTKIIADHLEINVRTVQRSLKENGDLVKFVRSELNEYLSDEFCRQGVMSEAVLRKGGRLNEKFNRPTNSSKKPSLKRPSSRRQAKSSLSTSSPFEIEQNERKVEHRKIGIQCYREYRRANPISSTARAICKDLTAIHGLDAVYIEHLIRVRRIKVQAYLKNRRLKVVIQLRAEKLSYAKIAPLVHLHCKTVEKMFHEYEASQIVEVSHDI